MSSLIRFVILTKWMKIMDDSFSYEMEEEAINEKSSGIGTSWVVLTASDCLFPEGFDASEVESGFFAPTNKDNHVGLPKKEHLTGEGEAIKRPSTLVCLLIQRIMEDHLNMPRAMHGFVKPCANPK